MQKVRCFVQAKDLNLGIKNLTGRDDDIARLLNVTTQATYDENGKQISKEVSATKYQILANGFEKQVVKVEGKPQITLRDIQNAGDTGLWVRFQNLKINLWTPEGKRFPEVSAKADGIEQVLDFGFDVEE